MKTNSKEDVWDRDLKAVMENMDLSYPFARSLLDDARSDGLREEIEYTSYGNGND